MNILDENIIASQRQRLRSWRIRVRQIGVDIARKGHPFQYAHLCAMSLAVETCFPF